MPTYTFENKRTKKVFIKEMKIAELDDYLRDNPTVSQVLVANSTLDAVRIGVKKPDSTFQKYILGRVKEAIPGNNLGGPNQKFSIPKEI